MDKLKKQIEKQLAIEQEEKTRSVDGKKIKFGWLAAWLVPMSMGMVKTAVEQIQDATARSFAILAVEELEDVVKLLTDGDPDNKLQIWEHYERTWKEKVKKIVPELVKVIELKMVDSMAKKLILEGFGKILENI